MVRGGGGWWEVEEDDERWRRMVRGGGGWWEVEEDGERWRRMVPGPHWIRCTTKGVHTASQTKATAIYALNELRFSCPNRKDVRSHREGPYPPSGVYQRKTTLDVIRHSYADWLKDFSEFL